MKKLALLGVLALSGLAAHADVLYSNGPVVNSSGVSVIGGSKPYRVGTYGVGDESESGISVADDFTVGGNGWNVTDLDFFNYQTGANSTFTFTDVTWSILSGANPNSGTVVASGTTSVTNGGLVGYRVTLGTQTNTDRAIFDLKADIPDVTLTAGTYWLTWGVTGSDSFSGPWQPLTSNRVQGNLMQNLGDGNGYAPVSVAVNQSVPRGAEAPFMINGTNVAVAAAVPEPATWASLAAGLGVLGFLRSRRRAG